MDERIYSKYFKAFGEPTRIRILRLLSAAEMTVGDIVRQVGLSQPTVSRHLAILREADIVTDRRDGQQVYYSLRRETVQNCCASFCDCLDINVVKGKKSRKN